MPFKRLPDRGCEVPGCPYKHYAKGYCKEHWRIHNSGRDPVAVAAQRAQEERKTKGRVPITIVPKQAKAKAPTTMAVAVPVQTGECPPHHLMCGPMENGVTIGVCKKCGVEQRIEYKESSDLKLTNRARLTCEKEGMLWAAPATTGGRDTPKARMG